jgi:hypothetical protein
MASTEDLWREVLVLIVQGQDGFQDGGIVWHYASVEGLTGRPPRPAMWVIWDPEAEPPHDTFWTEGDKGDWVPLADYRPDLYDLIKEIQQ